MDVYEQSVDLPVAADRAFAYLSEPANLPRYLPPVETAEVSAPGEIEMTGRSQQGPFHGKGYFEVDDDARRMEWGAQTDRKYSGWLQVEPGDGDRSQVTVHLEFGPRSAQDEIQEQSPAGQDPLEDSLRDVLASIREKLGESRAAPA